MGRKGVSKRKPRKSGPFSKADAGGSPGEQSGEHSLVQSLVKDRGAPPNRDGMHPPAGSNKKRRGR